MMRYNYLEKENFHMAQDENEKLDKIEDMPSTIENKYPNKAKIVNKPVMMNRPFFIAAIVIIVILILVLIGSLFKFSQVRQDYYNRDGAITFYNHQVGPRMGGGGSFFFQSSSTNNNSTTSVSAVSGVVTAVNGSSFDVGGGGTKTTVNTNGDTTWNTTNKKVSVNDSVVVFGTMSGSTITATSVQIENL